MSTKCQIECAINKKICDLNPIYLCQKDFDKPYVIDKPGHYILKENIKLSFFPKKLDSLKFNPLDKFGSPAGIKIISKYVILNLNGYAIYQSPQDYCVQRFFAIIQLNSMPFNVGVGPIAGEDRTVLDTAEYCIIKNGVIGLTAHQSILGNNNKNIILEDLNLMDFEVSGITLNNVDTVYLENIVVGRSIGIQRFLPISPHFAGLTFSHKLLTQVHQHPEATDSEKYDIKVCLKVIENVILPIFDTIYCENSLTEIYCSLKKKVLKCKHLKFLFNENKLSPCNMHGIKITGPNPSVGKFHQNVDDHANPSKSTSKGAHSKNIYINNVVVEKIHGHVDEEIICTKSNDVVHICAGLKATYSLIKEPSIILLMETIKKISENKILKKVIGSNIDSEILEFVKQGINGGNCGFTGSMDVMAHINKGIHGIRIGSSENVHITNTTVRNILNNGKPVDLEIVKQIKDNFTFKEIKIIDTTFLSPITYVGSYAMGIIISGCNKVINNCCDITLIKAPNGCAVGMAVNNESNDINISKTNISNLTSCAHCYDSTTLVIDEKSTNIRLNGAYINKQCQ